jgi:hypothetical protein
MHCDPGAGVMQALGDHSADALPGSRYQGPPAFE